MKTKRTGVDYAFTDAEIAQSLRERERLQDALWEREVLKLTKSFPLAKPRSRKTAL